MLYGTRAEVTDIRAKRGADGRATEAFVEVNINQQFANGSSPGYLFRAYPEPFDSGQLYTLDPEPNDSYGLWCKKVTEGLCAGAPNTLYDRLCRPGSGSVAWPDAARRAQERFLAGLDALRDAGLFHAFEPGKRTFIGGLGDVPTLLVQGPPGTGKSYTTAFALFARLQGALAAGIDFRVLVSCKTHAATDVLLKNIRDVQEDLRRVRRRRRDLFTASFDERLLDLRIFRIRPKGDVPDGVVKVGRKEDRPDGAPIPVDVIAGESHCIAAATPGGIRGLLNERWSTKLFGHHLVDCLVLDEASQMNLPEALMAALPLKPGGWVIVVGDHRQMPPIVRHDWLGEPRRTVQQFKAYESLFLTLRDQNPPPPMIKFEESFRLHAEMAEYLRHEIYRHDGIAFHSRQRATLPAFRHGDPFVASVLQPDQTIVAVVHDETASQVANPFEQALIQPVLATLADRRAYALDPRTGLGVVVPHRKQRAALQDALDVLSIRDPATGLIVLSAVDTVERFQGDERAVIVVSATESDPEYLLTRGEFLLEPRRLTVALSRAKQKVIVVASRSVFDLFSPAEETFANTQLWKNLLRRTCTVKLWEGDQHGHRVQVWGNAPLR